MMKRLIPYPFLLWLFLTSLALSGVEGCGGSSSNPPSFTTVPPQKLSALGVPLAAYVILSTNPDKQYPLTLDSTTNSFKGEISVKTGTTFDLTVIYTADDPVSGQILEIAHYIRRNLVAVGESMTVAYVGDEANWQTIFDLNPGSPNDLNLDGDAYFNFVEIGYGSDATSSASLPTGSRANGTVKDELTGSLDVGLPPPGSDLGAALRGESEVTIEALTPFDIKSIEIVSPEYGYEVLSTDEEMIADKKIRVLLHTAQFVVGPEVGSMTLTVRVTDEYDLVRETTFEFAVYNLSGTCGNGISEIGEECDDGNRVENDSCNNACLIVNCGNGAKSSGEECDDGNIASGDGCDATCKIEVPLLTVTSPVEGATVKDIVDVAATAESKFGVEIQSLRVTFPSGLNDQNNRSDTFETTWDTRLIAEDQEQEIRFETRDTGGRTSILLRKVTVDNKPNIRSFTTANGTNDILIQSGDSTTLSWQVDNVTTVEIDNGVGPVSASGSTPVAPTNTTDYTLTATRINNTLTTQPNSFQTPGQVTVRVNHPPTISNVRIETQTARTPNVPIPGNFRIAWDGSDPDGDLLEYDVTVTPDGETTPILDCTSVSFTSIVSGATNLVPSGCSFRERAGYGEVFSPFTLGARTDYTVAVTVYDPDNRQDAATGNGTILDDNLVGWWRFDEGAGTTAADSSGYGNGGTLNNFSNGWMGGVSGGALDLDGINDFVRVPDSFVLGPEDKDFTVEAWIKPEATSGAQMIFHRGLSNGGCTTTQEAYWWLAIRGDIANQAEYQACGRTDLTNFGAVGDRTEANPIDWTAQWTHLAAVHRVTDGPNTVVFYLNGRRHETVEIAGSSLGDVTPLGDLFIGSTLGTSNFLNGLIDEVAIYRRALSVDDVRRNCRRNDPAGNTCPNSKEPIILTPTPNQVLPPTRAYWSWRGERGVGGVELFDNLTYDLGYQIYVPILDQWTQMTELGQITTGYYVQPSTDIDPDSTYRILVTATDPATASTSQSTRPFSTDNSIVSWWKFDGDAIDSSGGGNDGSLFGLPTLPQYESSLLGSGLRFDGENDFVDVAHDPSLFPPALTWQVWVNPASLSFCNGNCGILAKSSGIGGNGYRLGIMPSGEVYFTFGDGVLGDSAIAPLQNSVGQWSQIAATHDGTNGKLYQNGVYEVTATAPLVDSGGPPNLVIGRDWNTGYFDGLIDEVVLYNRALSSADTCNSYLSTCFSANASAGLTCDPSCVGD